MKPLDPQAKALLTALAAAALPPLKDMELEYARTLIDGAADKMNYPEQAVAALRERTIPGPGGDLSLRIYTPPGKGPFPVVVFFHGGGWVFYLARHYDFLCTRLCNGTGSVVVSVDYRRSPETRYPGPLDDCYHALRWVHRNASEICGDGERIILAGDSAGGNLAAGVALKNRDENGPSILAQVLLYPATAWYDPPTPSYLEFANDHNLTRDSLIWFWEQYLETREQATEPYAAPLNAPDLQRLPETFIIVAGYDPLRDEGIAFGNKLQQAGVPVTLVTYDGMIHGFISFLGILDDAKKAIAQICEWLNKVLGKS
jgi:acetyl esterase